MKRSLLLLTLASLIFIIPALAEPPISPQPEKKVEEKYGFCPKTHIKGDASDCMICHVAGNFKVKETDPDSLRIYPCYGMSVKGGAGFYTIKDIGEGLCDNLVKFFDYLDRHSVDKAVLELNSPGGSLFEAWRAVGLMNDWVARKPGRIVETRVYGFAASAGFLITVSGTIGHRFASPTAELMWHELLSFSMFHLATPSSSEQEMKTLRHLQDTANSWLASRSKLSKEELDKLIKNAELWCNGKEAYQKYGFVDGLLGAVLPNGK